MYMNIITDINFFMRWEQSYLFILIKIKTYKYRDSKACTEVKQNAFTLKMISFQTSNVNALSPDATELEL